MCEAPALVWNLAGKGRIAEGYDADLVLVDLEEVHEVRNREQLTKCGWSPWDGQSLRGWPVATWVRGHCVYRDGKFDTSRRGEEVGFEEPRLGYWARVAGKSLS